MGLFILYSQKREENTPWQVLRVVGGFSSPAPTNPGVNLQDWKCPEWFQNSEFLKFTTSQTSRLQFLPFFFF